MGGTEATASHLPRAAVLLGAGALDVELHLKDVKYGLGEVLRHDEDAIEVAGGREHEALAEEGRVDGDSPVPVGREDSEDLNANAGVDGSLAEGREEGEEGRPGYHSSLDDGAVNAVNVVLNSGDIVRELVGDGLVRSRDRSRVPARLRTTSTTAGSNLGRRTRVSAPPSRGDGLRGWATVRDQRNGGPASRIILLAGKVEGGEA